MSGSLQGKAESPYYNKMIPEDVLICDQNVINRKLFSFDRIKIILNKDFYSTSWPFENENDKL